MSSHVDDPLADLLSDNSLDNEAFFEGGAAPASAQRRFGRATHSAKAPKTKIEDLFGIQEEGGATLKVPESPTATSTPHHAKDDNDDDELGFDPKKPKAGAGKRDLFDDLLSPIGAEALRKPAGATLKAPISRQSTDTTTDNSHLVARPKTSSGRRSSGHSAAAPSTEALGMFAKPNVPSSSGLSTPMQTKRLGAPATADWLGLGGGGGGNGAPVETEGVAVEATQPPVKVAVETTERVATPTGDTTAQNIMLLNTMAAEANSSYALLQQQEANLLMASQMGTHEQALLEMKRRQDAMMQQQERQFQALVQQKLQSQRQMEEHIRHQQQRINSHLQLLLVQPPPAMASDEGPTADVTANESALAVVELEANVKRLELERERLEESLRGVRENCDHELETLRASYRKQLQVVEEHRQAVEERLRRDLDEQREYFLKKVQLLESDAAQAKAAHDSLVTHLKQEHEDELRRGRKKHEEDLAMLREDHRRMLDSVRQAKLMEFAVVQENGSYLQTLRAASTNLEQLTGGLQELRDEMQLKLETDHRERLAKLEGRERRVEDAERRLKIGEERAEAERSHLMAVVAGLELQLSALGKERSEEQWLVRQQMASLEAERAAFVKEKEYVREQMGRDEKRLAALKEAQLAEQQRHAAELSEQQAKLSIERAQLETRLLLNPDPSGEQQRAQLEASLQVARDAAKQAEAERDRCRQMQRHLEQARRQLADEEHLAQAKRDELEAELRSCQVARQKALADMQATKAVEQSLQAKMLFLSGRAREINTREASLSEERLEVRRARLELEQAKRNLQKKCFFCHMNTEAVQLARSLNPASKAKQLSPIDLALEAESTAAFNMMSPAHNAEAPAELSVHPGEPPELSAEQRDDLMQQFSQSSDLVDRLLDENIEDSFRRMRASIGGLD